MIRNQNLNFTKKRKDISIYVRNKNITPSSYYRIIQYTGYFEGNIVIREIAPTFIYKKQLNLNKNNLILKFLIALIYYFTMVIRSTFFLLCDYIINPKCIIVSKTFCPRYTPLFMNILIKKVATNTNLYWDFDDNIFESKEISISQAKILEEYSKKIVVTNEFLKSKIREKYQNKVVLLCTTDGDLQGFDFNGMLNSRIAEFKKEVKLIWVATSGNIIHLEKIIKTLDETAKVVKEKTNKQLVLTVVCNNRFEYNSNYIQIRNIVWSREVAKEEIYSSHIGIMPLILNEYSLGKGAFKLVQYISTGLPVIASKVGFNEEVVSCDSGVLVDDSVYNDDWTYAILNIIESEKKWMSYSINAYKRWKQKYSFEYNLNFWKDELYDYSYDKFEAKER